MSGGAAVAICVGTVNECVGGQKLSQFDDLIGAHGSEIRRGKANLIKLE